MRVVLYQEEALRLRQRLCEHGLPEEIDLSGAGDGMLVVVVLARDTRVAAAAEHWLRSVPRPDAFIAACTAATRAQCRQEPWWPGGICDVVAADDEPGMLTELALRLKRLHELESILTSDWLRKRAVGHSAPWRETLRAVAQVGRFGSGACLLTGDSGCGKELLARLIHDLDPVRRSGPFIVVDCTTLSPELSGSELFGHARGAFTHAVAARDGAVALADGGTLFLDEIGELDLLLQARLLRVVQERAYKRVGDDNWRRSDFRLTCATNRSLDAEVTAGRFRSDLYFRITQWTIHAPPLAARRDDIPLLVEHFLAEHAGTPPRVMPEVMQQLMARDYPGNVRELRHVVLRMADRQQGFHVLSTGCLDLPLADVMAATGLMDGWEGVLARAVEGALDAGLGLKNIGQIAEAIAVKVAERRAGSTSRAAELLRVTPRALQLRRQGRPTEGCP
ncbi:DNA-binding transcriptional response regulator, NtrC family, contains REC, AAA-type ATPase, and a Fis-type DNA-binding domains [Cupriavidus sp. OV038]|jgi:transcriptional regulator with GAF, ATPase, and Fis domain|uniref:sigma-54-dependent transcriptional regulator n=1 Tax=unclassified Cupriavidus TaxID=2640874 RepID=UPI0008F2DEAA|nr:MULTISPECIES: sigma 54-interacting transcriptional regulator [unclassified Cupriavidus]SFC92043.1 DNA-binding transcriptional response regulator, NtrC family, contains REC, AAA-type ATPase, and a Fis-type DNA-binding domains [Cupriavidus sp. OV038]SFP56264.1 DNA-binding transcriptional response regulator, NtrC family, contains REC, AAA-type ATPase, and a Fis-type DNA-binding domains [Cupriavidus sp. OV096]